MSASSPASILVVDDNRSSRLILVEKLRAEGFLVQSAGGGVEALARLQATLEDSPHDHPIDLAILDVLMPDLDGLEVLRRVRKAKSPADLPVVMATAKEETQDMVTALNAGANDYVVKPVNFPVLLARIETQLALREARLALKHAHESLIDTAKMESVGFLAAGVAHEIRNPLARIQLGIQALRRSEVILSDEKLNRCVLSVQSACDKADEVVGGLMKVASNTRPHIVDLDLDSVIHDALVVIHESIESPHIRIVLEVDQASPPARYSFSELRQVLVNVFLNAAQAMSGGGTLTVRTGMRTLEAAPATPEGRSGNVARRGDEMLTIEIEDTGPGIPESKLLTAFDAFYTTKPTGTATGLGLTIAKKILDVHGGFITLSNREEGGARVTILLPKAGGFRTTV